MVEDRCWQDQQTGSGEYFDELEVVVIRRGVLHVDETSWRQEGSRCNPQRRVPR